MKAGRGLCRTVLSLLPSSFCLFLLFCFFPLSEAIAGILAVTVHECGHVFVYYRLRKTLPAFKGQSGGFLLSGGFLSYKEELLYAGGGAFFNLASLPIAFFLSKIPALSAGSTVFFAFSLLYALFNLLPVPPLDGSRLFYLLGCRFFGLSAGEKMAKAVAAVLIFFMLFGSLWFSLGSGSFFYGVFLSFRFLFAYFEAF